MKKSLFVLFLYSSLLTASEIAYRFVFGIETLPAAKMAETFALTFMIAALYLFARYKASRLLIAVFFAFSMIANLDDGHQLLADAERGYRSRQRGRVDVG
ncbi:hypothetical protein OL959_001774 [Neisseria gonorrhoeae]